MNADPNILQIKYASVIQALSTTTNKSLDEALELFYHSQTYQLMREGISDMHCMSDGYLVEEILMHQR